MPYSLDLRKRAVMSVHNGMRRTVTCRLFNICKRTLDSWLRLEKTQGDLKPQTGFQKGHSHGIKDLGEFRAFVELHPDYTQEEMASYFDVGSSTIGRALKKIGFSRKKKSNIRREERRKTTSLFEGNRKY